MRRLERWKLQATARGLLPEERVGTCLRRVVPGEAVKVWKAREADRAHYSGLMVCGSVWHCPVCAAKISERRRVELVAAIAAWKATGGEVLLLTLTVPHYQHQALATVLKGFEKARVKQRESKRWKTLKASIGLAGSVRALEVTHGANGWHVHSHELLFLRPGSVCHPGDIQALEAQVLASWQHSCLRSGLGEPNAHGVSLEDGSKAALYAGKWGLAEEVTKAHVKRGKFANPTPWDLLRQVAAEELAPGEISDAAELFQEYAKAFKGKRQLAWSKGLRDLLGLDVEATDEELAASQEESAVLLGSLSRANWARVVLAEKRGEVLEAAAAAGWPGVLALIARLKGGGGGG